MTAWTDAEDAIVLATLFEPLVDVAARIRVETGVERSVNGVSCRRQTLRNAGETACEWTADADALVRELLPSWPARMVCVELSRRFGLAVSVCDVVRRGRELLAGSRPRRLRAAWDAQHLAFFAESRAWPVGEVVKELWSRFGRSARPIDVGRARLIVDRGAVGSVEPELDQPLSPPLSPPVRPPRRSAAPARPVPIGRHCGACRGYLEARVDEYGRVEHVCLLCGRSPAVSMRRVS
jgi:hypothetical protein